MTDPQAYAQVFAESQWGKGVTFGFTPQKLDFRQRIMPDNLAECICEALTKSSGTWTISRLDAYVREVDIFYSSTLPPSPPYRLASARGLFHFPAVHPSLLFHPLHFPNRSEFTIRS